MLLQIRLKNFRQHEDIAFDFTEGLNVIRGLNEKGKTTVLEAIGYGLGGVDALRDPLAQVVTWGKQEKDLAVEQVWRFDGITYTLKRSKSGAQLDYRLLGDLGVDHRVVGQTEVTKFMQTRLGCDMKIAAKLMLASQGSIRGALAEGPTKTAELIETLAGFEQIDRLIELVQANYVTGPATTAEDRVRQAEGALDAAKAAVVPVDTGALEARVAALTADLRREQQAIDAEHKPAYEKAKAAVKEVETARSTRNTLEAQRLRAHLLEESHRQQLEQARAQAARTPADPAPVRERIRVAENIDAEIAIYRQFAALEYPDTYWEGDEASFNAEVAKAAATRQTHRERIVSIDSQISALNATRSNSRGVCKACGQTLPNAAAVAEHNAKIDRQISEINAERKLVVEAHNAAADEVNGLHAVQVAAQPFAQFLAKHGDRVHVVLVPATYPPKLEWDGAVPKANVDVGVLRAELAKIEAAIKACERASAQAEQLEKTLNEDLATISRLEKEIDALAVADELPWRVAALDVAAEKYNNAMVAITNWQTEKEKVLFEISAAKDAERRALAAVTAAEAAVKKANAELEQLHFNNALLKRIRAARPIIADKLWAMVLSAVSTYFSRMRGKPSVVGREGKSFVVDGKRSALSGSTLDVLGLAIRVALTRTFIPNASMLVLDEPAAACDEERSAAMMGFLVSSGFPQTLMVTHEDLSESVAANLITI
jgi:DNA repair exonuclease SbcCD ATPase subunit